MTGTVVHYYCDVFIVIFEWWKSWGQCIVDNGPVDLVAAGIRCAMNVIHCWTITKLNDASNIIY